jgi:L-threonylcarbamoyladenylate synthase
MTPNEMPEAFSLAELDAALGALRRGEIVVYPTETFYGLGVNALDAQALARLFALKEREPGKPVGLIASDVAMVREVIREFPAPAQRLANRFWPGPLTLVMPARAGLAPELLNESGGVGIRVSPHPAARELARRLGAPLTATSANPAGRDPAATVAQARNYFGAGVAHYLDGGRLGAQPPSTVVEFKEASFRVVRPGAIAAAALAAALRD